MAAEETAAATQSQSEAKPAVEAPPTTLATATTEEGTQTQTAETQATQSTETTKPGETTTETKPAAEAAKPLVPEKYEFTAPEGTEFDPTVIEAYSAAAKVAGLSQEAAQKLIETMTPALAARQTEQYKAVQEEWRTTSSTDNEFGGDKLKENLGVAKKALDQFDPLPTGTTTTPLRTLLESTGLGNHPEVLRVLYRVGKAISEDKFVAGRQAATAEEDPVAKLYPTMQPKK
jgi:hypothetical protein